MRKSLTPSHISGESIIDRSFINDERFKGCSHRELNSCCVNDTNNISNSWGVDDTVGVYPARILCIRYHFQVRCGLGDLPDFLCQIQQAVLVAMSEPSCHIANVTF